MSGTQKPRKSVPISETVAVDTREVNVVIDGVDCSGIACSFAVHLVKDGRRIASRFLFQPSQGAEAAGDERADRFAHFDFMLPIAVVADGKLSVEIEPTEPIAPGGRPLLERLGNPTLSVHLMLQSA